MRYGDAGSFTVCLTREDVLLKLTPNIRLWKHSAQYNRNLQVYDTYKLTLGPL